MAQQIEELETDAPSGAGLHPAADFQSAARNWIDGPKSADRIGAQDAILPHLVRQVWNSYFLTSA
jgi:hypothetical protein